MDNSHNNKRIAKNTLMLYIRMLIITLVSLYTTRVTLQILGVSDFGLRNVIGGIVGFMTILTNAMINAAQRYLAFDLGKNDIKSFNTTYCILINVFVIISIFCIIILEFIGPYLINNQLSIPCDRIFAVHVVFQLTVVNLVLETIIIPFSATIIATEKMDVFAYISLLNALFKLMVVYILYISPFDKLITVVLLTTIATASSNVLYPIYCRRKVPGCVFSLKWDSALVKKMLSFTGWNLFGSATSVLNMQGQSLLLNIFFGPIVNASKAIADNVNSFIQSFVGNFYMAVGPQIVKTYAEQNLDYTKRIVIYSSKAAFILISIIAIPVIFCIRPLLVLWLGADQVTELMVSFSQWTLICSIISTLDYPITQTIRATGNIKNYQLCVGIQTLLFIPICYILFKIGYSPIYSMIVLSSISGVVLNYRIHALTRVIKITLFEYYKNVVFPLAFSIVVAVSLVSVIHIDGSTFIELAHNLSVDFILIAVTFFIFGLSNIERNYCVKIVKNKIRR